jgi:hypothetical protein
MVFLPQKSPDLPIYPPQLSRNHKDSSAIKAFNRKEWGIRELHKKDDPIVKWFDKGFPQTTLANGEVD